ncbi:ribosomal-protein-alanine N-acetyltransferase [Aquisalibacillus elongatus]|uniref:Ribosomal-protein-alanine N-acetyltransferase n=2 Tax=Aquisalibacillus elongatus TaxID=485577 RepID=A0A3N5C222_9BACI|nr:ribosomal-protein-alanine N-acetyltransferase [Aquisalibacillus elongatus]
MHIKSERLNFRKYNEDDLDFLYLLLSDPDMVKHIGEGKTRDIEGTRQFLEWIYHTYRLSADLGLMVLQHKENNQPIGHAGLVPQTINGVAEIEIGYWIARKHWGKGYATEAAEALKDFGQNNLGKERFISLIQPENIASRKVASKIGMSLEKEIQLKGQDVQIYSTWRG